MKLPQTVACDAWASCALVSQVQAIAMGMGAKKGQIASKLARRVRVEAKRRAYISALKRLERVKGIEPSS